MLERDDNAFAIKLNKIAYDYIFQVFQIIDRTAIPIALWLRKNDFESNAIQDNFDKLLKCKINELPYNIKQLRLEAFQTGNQEHIGNYLALLWEDPNLRPPEIHYTNPN